MSLCQQLDHDDATARVRALLVGRQHWLVASALPLWQLPLAAASIASARGKFAAFFLAGAPGPDQVLQLVFLPREHYTARQLAEGFFPGDVPHMEESLAATGIVYRGRDADELAAFARTLAELTVAT